MINILTDSTCDLGKDLAARFSISMIPLYVIMGEQTYADGKDIQISDLFKSVEQTGKLPKTSAPSVPDFQKFFDRPGESIYIGISSQLSATVQNATLAKESFEDGRVYVIDSLNLSTGIGLLAIKAAELRDQGLPAAEIARQVTEMIPRVKTSFIIDTMEYVYKGGRCTAIQSLAGSLLSIRPILDVRPDGSLGVKAKIRGTRAKGLKALLDDFTENLPQIDLKRVFVTHSGCDEDAEMLKSELSKLAPIQEVLITYAGSVIASHCGPNTIGILYTLK
jgi:DegV family protein with EDD domain